MWIKMFLCCIFVDVKLLLFLRSLQASVLFLLVSQQVRTFGSGVTPPFLLLILLILVILPSVPPPPEEPRGSRLPRPPSHCSTLSAPNVCLKARHRRRQPRPSAQSLHCQVNLLLHLRDTQVSL